MCWVFVAACGLSVVAVSGCCFPGSGLSCHGARALGTWASGAVGGVALLHMLSSRTRDGIDIPCIGSWILNHWTHREVPGLLLMGTRKKLVPNDLVIQLNKFPKKCAPDAKWTPGQPHFCLGRQSSSDAACSVLCRGGSGGSWQESCPCTDFPPTKAATPSFGVIVIPSVRRGH